MGSPVLTRRTGHQQEQDMAATAVMGGGSPGDFAGALVGFWHRCGIRGLSRSHYTHFLMRGEKWHGVQGEARACCLYHFCDLDFHPSLGETHVL